MNVMIYLLILRGKRYVEPAKREDTFFLLI